MRSKLLFLLAIIMAIVTTILFFNYTRQIETEEVAQQEMVQVVKAIETIAVDEMITDTLLEVVKVTKENIHPNAITEIAEVQGNFSTASIAQGEILATHHVKDQETEKIFVSRKIREGYRAVSVNAPRVASAELVTNLIEPEDYVSIVLTEDVMNDDQEEIVSKQIFANIRVLAVGRKLDRPVDDVSNYVEYSALTLEMKPEDTVVLINAYNRGTLHFTLHSSISAPETEE
jgi:pilus assembly protein CpaB